MGDFAPHRFEFLPESLHCLFRCCCCGMCEWHTKASSSQKCGAVEIYNTLSFCSYAIESGHDVIVLVCLISLFVLYNGSSRCFGTPSAVIRSVPSWMQGKCLGKCVCPTVAHVAFILLRHLADQALQQSGCRCLGLGDHRIPVQ